MYFSAEVGSQNDPKSKAVYDDKESGKVMVNGDYGNYARASGESSLFRTGDTLLIRMNARVKCSAGPTFGKPNFKGHNGATATAMLSRGGTFTFGKATPYRISTAVGRKGPWQFHGFSTVGEVYIELLTGGSPQVVAQVGSMGYGTSFVSDTLPAGTYRISFRTYLNAGWVGNPFSGSDFPDRTATEQGAVETVARIDFGKVSAANREWRRFIADFSDTAVLLRGLAEGLQDQLAGEKELIATAGENPLPAFDDAFQVTPHPLLKNKFNVTPREDVDIFTPRKAVTNAVTNYQEIQRWHESLMNVATQALEYGYLPNVTPFYLDWDVPSSGPARYKLSTLSFYKARTPLTTEELAAAKAAYEDARKWFPENLPLLLKRGYMLKRRSDFIVTNIGLAAEEIVRQIKAAPSLPPGEKNGLLDCLNLADWAWRE